jgi:M6 family metalloprotease-like protein
MSAIFGETLIFTQDKGPDVELVVFGDEFYARYETTDGYTVVYDSNVDLYCYALVVGGRFVSSGVQTSKRPPLGTRRHLKESEDVRNDIFDRRFATLRPPEPVAASHVMRTLGRDNGLLEGRRVSNGPVRGLTVFVEFQDVSSTVTREDIEGLLNGTNYRGNGNHCSVNEYFKLISDGKLDYTNTVVGPVKLSRNRHHYKSTLLVEEALDIVVNELNVNLEQFDSKNEGVVDAVNFMYAGRTLYEGELWPHNSVKILNYNGIRTHFYMLTSMGRRAVDLSIGTFCHENGHLLCRFPDLYDYGRRDGDFEKSQGIGRYCLMGSGNHLNRGRTPAPACSYLRDLAGWTDTEITLHSPGDYTARHGDYGTVMKFQTDKLNEYFIVENRTRMGLDEHLPASGLAVYHCDTLGSNEWQGGTWDRHYQCGLVQADGHLDLENNRNPGDEGDLFGRVDGVALSDGTSPTTREWDGSDSGFVVSGITDPSEAIRFRTGKEVGVFTTVQEIAPDLLIPDNKPEGVTSKMKLTQAGVVKNLKVAVDIIHTWIGDLTVEIVSPSGKTVVLHDETGMDHDDIRTTYDADSIPGLTALEGEPVQGEWSLKITDSARRDTGRLNWWKLEVEYEPTAQVVQREAEPGLSIPDSNTQGVSNSIQIEHEGTAKDVQVDVDITHTYIGDLMVDLVSPSGQSATLHNRTGYGRNDLRMSYDKSSAPALEVLEGDPIQGDWTLRVRDLEGLDTGTLDKWSLTITY